MGLTNTYYPKEKVPGPHVFTGEFYKNFKVEMGQILFHIFQVVEITIFLKK